MRLGGLWVIAIVVGAAVFGLVACVSQNVIRKPPAVARPGNAANRPVEIKPTSVFRGQICGATIAEDRFIRGVLAYLEQNVIDAVPIVVVWDDKFLPLCLRGNQAKNGAHIHDDTRQMCILRSNLYESTLWHEAMHALEFKLRPSRSDVAARWKIIAGDVYGRKLAGVTLPAAGVLSDLGATKYEEDLAEWGRAIYCYGYDRPNALVMVGDFSDPRYLQKLEFLRMHGFVGEGVYLKAMELIETGSRK